MAKVKETLKPCPFCGGEANVHIIRYKTSMSTRIACFPCKISTEAIYSFYDGIEHYII